MTREPEKTRIEKRQRETRQRHERTIRATLTPSSLDDLDAARSLIRRMNIAQRFASGEELSDIGNAHDMREETVVANIREEFARMWIAERTKLLGRRRR